MRIKVKESPLDGDDMGQWNISDDYNRGCEQNIVNWHFFNKGTSAPDNQPDVAPYIWHLKW